MGYIFPHNYTLWLLHCTVRLIPFSFDYNPYEKNIAALHISNEGLHIHYFFYLIFVVLFLLCYQTKIRYFFFWNKGEEWLKQTSRLNRRMPMIGTNFRAKYTKYNAI